MTPNRLLQHFRQLYKPQLPTIFEELNGLSLEEGESFQLPTTVSALFPQTEKQTLLHFKKASQPKTYHPLKIGVVLSGGQAPGGHNVITGLYDALMQLNEKSELIGFLDGPKGILHNRYRMLSKQILSTYRNQGGFDLIGSGRDKIETLAHFQAAEATVKALNLDGLVIIGGDDSNTNAALLAEYFKEQSCKTCVVGVPKTIDGDLKNQAIEVSFGFDTACKTYSEIIGNIMRDMLSAKKYYYFIKLMGRSASHVTLECALQTQPNLAFIGEEVEKKQWTVKDLTQQIADLVCARAKENKHFGLILIPEGIVEFIPEFRQLMHELNMYLANKNFVEVLDRQLLQNFLSQEAWLCFAQLPQEIQQQLLMDRDPHGNVQVSKIETERLFIMMVEKELNQRKAAGEYQGKFNAQPHFCGYEGRACLPSNFDSNYCYSLGHVAALLLDHQKTGYICCVKNLKSHPSDWVALGIPLVSLMHLEIRHGKEKAVIQKALVNLDDKPFQQFQKLRDEWKINESYIYPGPLQFFGPAELSDAITQTLDLEN